MQKQLQPVVAYVKRIKLADILLVLGVIMFIALMLLTCNGCPKKDGGSRDPYDSVLADQQEQNREYQWKIDSLQMVVEVQDSNIAVLNKTKDIFKDIARKQKLETDKYANMYRAAKALLDTNVMILSCDSLVDEYQILAGIHETALRYSDSVITAQHEAIANRDTIIQAQVKWIKDQQTFMEQSDSLYNSLYTYAMKQEVRHKRTKKFTWVAALAAFVVGVLISK